MGVVYKALDVQTEQPRAIKMLHAHKVSDSEALKRFNREARTVAQVAHHHIVTLYDFGMSETRQPFLVMDFIQGHSLKDELESKGPLPFDRAANIFGQVLDALECAHGKDVVHRDLKPENIILTKNGEEKDWVKLVDFGLSKLRDNDPTDEELYHITKAGDVCGSPPYMSPEQCLSNSVVDPRSDIYSFAICVYECLSGKLPYKAKSAIEMIDCHLYGAPIPFSEISPELSACNETTYVLKKALAKEPENRQASADELKRELSDALRRDWPKVRAYRFRMEDAAFKDLESEAIALETGEHPALDLSKFGVGVQDAIKEMNSSTVDHDAVPTPLPTQKQKVESSNSVEPEEDEEPQPGIVEKLMIALGLRQKVGDENYGYVSEAELGYSSCPFCSAPVKARLRFCVNCQRQLPTVEEFSKLRANSGRFAFSKSHFRSEAAETKGFSKKAKMRMANRGLSLVQKLIAVILIFVVGYGVYVGFNDKTVVQQIQRVILSLK